jgi:hypothetical protein
LLEYKDGELLYYPTNSEPYQIIVLWPAKSIQELYDENDYYNQDNFESFLRSDQLSDTISNPVKIISSVLPIYFKHSRSKISFIFQKDQKEWGAFYKFSKRTKINNNPPYFNKDSISVQVIYDRVKEGISKKEGIIQLDVQVGIQSYIYNSFSFDVSTLKAGVNRTVVLSYPFPKAQ